MTGKMIQLSHNLSRSPAAALLCFVFLAAAPFPSSPVCVRALIFFFLRCVLLPRSFFFRFGSPYPRSTVLYRPLFVYICTAQLIFDLFEDDDYHKVDVEVKVEAREGDNRTATSYVW